MTPLQIIERGMESRALADYKDHAGCTLLVSTVSGYRGNDSIDIRCDPPARMRVSKTSTEDIKHWNDNWLDPYWNAELLDPHPALKDVRTMWVFGPSYCTDGRTEPSSDWTVEKGWFQRLQEDWARFVNQRP